MKEHDIGQRMNRLSAQGKMNFQASATEEQIHAFEERNGIRLPSQFREWLLFCDGGEFFLPAGVQLYGVSHKPLIDVNDEDRPDDTYIVIGALAAGDPILAERIGERIAIYNHEAGRIESDEIYEDFFSFMEDLPGILGIGG